MEIYGNAALDLTNHDNSNRYFGIGSLVGDGIVYSILSVGAGNLSSDFSGLWPGGICYKTGKGILDRHSPPLNSDTFYDVKQGTLRLTDPDGVGGGASGSVFLDKGRLTGNGAMNGPAYLGDAIGTGDAVIAPGVGKKDSAALTIVGPVSFNSDSVYECNLNAQQATADKIVGNGGVTILTGATFSLVPVGSGALPVGTIFTVIDNTATGQISGTFTNLADGATISAAGTNLKVSYHGGTGNDLTLTVVP